MKEDIKTKAKRMFERPTKELLDLKEKIPGSKIFIRTGDVPCLVFDEWLSAKEVCHIKGGFDLWSHGHLYLPDVSEQDAIDFLLTDEFVWQR